MEPADPIERIEPADPIERIEPADPMERIEPADPTEPIDPMDPSDQIDAAEKREFVESTEPTDSGDRHDQLASEARPTRATLVSAAQPAFLSRGGCDVGWRDEDPGDGRARAPGRTAARVGGRWP
jgi:hypothetical protein